MNRLEEPVVHAIVTSQGFGAAPHTPGVKTTVSLLASPRLPSSRWLTVLRKYFGEGLNESSPVHLSAVAVHLSLDQLLGRFLEHELAFVVGWVVIQIMGPHMHPELALLGYPYEIHSTLQRVSHVFCRPYIDCRVK